MKNKNFQYSVQKIVERMLIEFTAILSECEKQVMLSGNPKGAWRDVPCLGFNKERIANVLLIFRKNRLPLESCRIIWPEHRKERSCLFRQKGLRRHGEQTVHTLPEKYCWTVPFAGKQHSPDYNILITRMFEDISRNELRLGAEAGLLSFHRSAGTEQFLYVEVEATKKDARQLKEIIRLPAASFLCAVRQESDIGSAALVFPELFAQKYDKIIMETELFSGDYDVAHPKFELRCSLPPEKK